MWHDSFEAFFVAINPDLNPDKVALLRAHVSCKLFKIIKSATIYAAAISQLKARFVKQKSEVFARYKLATYKQQSGETLDAFLDNLKGLASEYSFTDCTATRAEKLAIRDSYITAMASNAIRQRLLENLSLDLSTAVKQARALEMFQLHSASYVSETNTTMVVLIDDQAKPKMDPNSFLIEMSDSPNPSECAATVYGQRCLFCRGSLHPRAHYPAKKTSCSNCQKVGHYARVCKLQRKRWNINGKSTNSNLVAGIILDTLKQSTPATMRGATVAAASPALQSVYRTVLPVELNGAAQIEPPAIFDNLTVDCHPIQVKSRRYSKEDSEFIKKEVKRLLEEGIITLSHSSWSAQVVVVDQCDKKRLVIDYSQTINEFTNLIAYPVPVVTEMIEKMSTYRYFSSIDLKAAYHQIPLNMADRNFTAFERKAVRIYAIAFWSNQRGYLL
ncbi:uncharacterized protein [Palaemon carinicauda]|uniref:uncharacterized protein n=1 Tax=Palaemon carinicauda TaxID=392227 RepID=UPI0035B5A152